MALKFSKSGPKQTKRQLQAVARSLGIVFPKDFRDFLVKHNGGVPKPNTLRSAKGCVDAIEFFYSIGARASERNLVKMTESYRDELALPHQYLPVALSDTHDLLLLHVAGRSAGKVDWWTVISEGFSSRHVSRYCNFFSALVALFEPEAISARDKADFDELFVAIKDGKKRKIAELLQRIDLATLPSDQPHPVIQVVYATSPTLLQLLLEQGLSTKVKDPLGNSAMSIAKRNSSTQSSRMHPMALPRRPRN